MEDGQRQQVCPCPAKDRCRRFVRSKKRPLRQAICGAGHAALIFVKALG